MANNKIVLVTGSRKNVPSCGNRTCQIRNKAYHSENTAFGIIIDDGEHKYYVTDDTLYNSNILKSLPDDIYAVFLPINGFGNNMNMTDAARFAKACRAKYTVPIHFVMFDSIDPKVFAADNKIIPEVYT